MFRCIYCGTGVYSEMNFCPGCGRAFGSNVSKGSKKKGPELPELTSRPILAGLFLLIGAVWCLINALFILIFAGDYGAFMMGLVGIGIIVLLEFAGFALGVSAAYHTFRRINYRSAVTGSGFVILTGFLSLFPALVSGIVAIPCTLIALILIIKSKNEFDVLRRFGKYTVESSKIKKDKDTEEEKKPPSNASRLRELQKLKDDELITDEEFEEKRKKLVEQL